MTIATVPRRRHPLLDLPADADRWDGAACHDHDAELWFRDDFSGTAANADTEEAKRICQGCTIREQCLSWAITHAETWGVWGGMTTDERNNRNGQCRTCPTPIPPRSRATYCDGCRNKARARQDRSRAKKKENRT
ncbi:MAG TPA: WhiB family transcriptional regulator [Jiangellaceae bacterium]|nr:WhiB family transcriptional regulator [Jiangellaceae bacterium]